MHTARSVFELHSTLMSNVCPPVLLVGVCVFFCCTFVFFALFVYVCVPKFVCLSVCFCLSLCFVLSVCLSAWLFVCVNKCVCTCVPMFGCSQLRMCTYVCVCVAFFVLYTFVCARAGQNTNMCLLRCDHCRRSPWR